MEDIVQTWRRQMLDDIEAAMREPKGSSQRLIKLRNVNRLAKLIWEAGLSPTLPALTVGRGD